MYPVELARLGKIGKVAANGLQGDTEMLRQKFDADLAVAARDLEDFGVAKRAGHSRLSFLFATVPLLGASRKSDARIS